MEKEREREREMERKQSLSIGSEMLVIKSGEFRLCLFCLLTQDIIEQPHI